MNHLLKSFCTGLLRSSSNSANIAARPSPILCQSFFQRSIYLLTEFNCVDNSELGQVSKRYRKPYLIGFYRKRRTADIGDVIKVAVKGRPCKALVVATRKPKRRDMIPRYDNNNIILLDDSNNPMGSRIRGPLPTVMRKNKDKYPKALAQGSRFI